MGHFVGSGGGGDRHSLSAGGVEAVGGLQEGTWCSLPVLLSHAPLRATQGEVRVPVRSPLFSCWPSCENSSSGGGRDSISLFPRKPQPPPASFQRWGMVGSWWGRRRRGRRLKHSTCLSPASLGWVGGRVGGLRPVIPRGALRFLAAWSLGASSKLHLSCPTVPFPASSMIPPS